MFSLKKLRMTIRITPEIGMPSMVTSGPCGACGKEMERLVFISEDETAREAFEYFWRTTEEDCRFRHRTQA